MTTTITCADQMTTPAMMGFKRGDYVCVSGGRALRIVRVTDTVITARSLHRWRWLERLHCRWEAIRWTIRS